MYYYIAWFLYLPVSFRLTYFIATDLTTNYLSHCIACGVGGHGYHDYFIWFSALILTVLLMGPITYGITEYYLAQNANNDGEST